MTKTALWAAALACAAVAVGVSLAVGAEPGDLDMTKIFHCTASDDAGQAACERARGLIVFNCTVCHLFVRIVRKQADAAGWDGVLARHRTRVPQLSDEDFRAIRNYLIANFRPDLDPPALPDFLAGQY